MYLHVFWLRKGPSIRYLHNYCGDEGFSFKMRTNAGREKGYHASCVHSYVCVHITIGFELVTRELELITRGFEFVTCGFELAACVFKLVTHGFELVARRVELVTHKFELVDLNS